MKICRYSMTFLIVMLLYFCSVFAVDDIFNKTGKINGELECGGVMFTIPDYYKIYSQDSSNDVNTNAFVNDSDTAAIGINSMNADTMYYIDATSDEDFLRKCAEMFIDNTIGKSKPIVQYYSDATLYGYDSISYYAEFKNENRYYTITVMHDINSIVTTCLILDSNITDTKYETDYVNMLKNAYVKGKTLPTESTPSDAME